MSSVRAWITIIIRNLRVELSTLSMGESAHKQLKGGRDETVWRWSLAGVQLKVNWDQNVRAGRLWVCFFLVET